MNVPFVDLYAQYTSIREEIDAAIAKVISETSFIGGNQLNRFCEEFAALLGRKHCIAVGNGTDALIIALKSLGIGPGDKVITVANSFIATSEAISATGARPVFVDCRQDTLEMNADLIEQAIDERVKAIVPVHLYGQPANMSDIMQVARRHHLYVVEDCAQAHLASFDGRLVSGFGDIATFSFYPGKNLGAYGDAGAIVTDNDDLATWMHKYANHGRMAKYNHEFEGVNSRMDNLQAAILLAKLGHLPQWTEQRRRAADRYRELLAGIGGIQVPHVDARAKHVYHLFVILAEHRDALMKHLKEAGVSTGIHYPIGLPFLKAYEYLGHQPADFPVCHGNQEQLLSLPIFAEITDEQMEYVCTQIRRFYGE